MEIADFRYYTNIIAEYLGGLYVNLIASDDKIVNEDYLKQIIKLKNIIDKVVETHNERNY